MALSLSKGRVRGPATRVNGKALRLRWRYAQGERKGPSTSLRYAQGERSGKGVNAPSLRSAGFQPAKNRGQDGRAPHKLRWRSAQDKRRARSC